MVGQNEIEIYLRCGHNNGRHEKSLQFRRNENLLKAKVRTLENKIIRVDELYEASCRGGDAAGSEHELYTQRGGLRERGNLKKNLKIQMLNYKANPIIVLEIYLQK